MSEIYVLCLKITSPSTGGLLPTGLPRLVLHFQGSFDQEYMLREYRAVSTKKQLCKIKRIPSDWAKTTPEEFERYCRKSKSNVVFPCPPKILKSKSRQLKNRKYIGMIDAVKRWAKRKTKKRKNRKKTKS